MSILYEIMEASWQLALQMAPYLALGFMVAGALHAFLPVRLVARYLGGETPGSVLRAVFVGIPLPLCSCGVLPVAASLRRAGAGKAPTLAFLVTTPVTGVDSIMATFALLGLPFTLLRMAASLIIGLVVGILVPGWVSVSDDREITEKRETESSTDEGPARATGPLKRVRMMLEHALFDVMEGLSGSLIGGLVIAGLITVLLPPETVEQYVGGGVYGILAATIIGIPLYVCATGSVPIAAVMILKGFTPGAALAFLIAGPATNAVALATVRKILGSKAMFLYLGTIFAGAVSFGMVTDAVGMMPLTVEVAVHGSSATHAWWKPAIAALLFGWAFVLYVRNSRIGRMISTFINKMDPSTHHTQGENDMQLLIQVPDMNCPHCKMTITKGLEEMDGVMHIEVDLSARVVKVDTDDSVEPDQILDKISSLGYTPEINAR